MKSKIDIQNVLAINIPLQHNAQLRNLCETILA